MDMQEFSDTEKQKGAVNDATKEMAAQASETTGQIAQLTQQDYQMPDQVPGYELEINNLPIEQYKIHFIIEMK
jgi:hypothetical protein